MEIQIKGNQITLVHDSALHSRMLVRKCVAYIHGTHHFKELDTDILNVDTEDRTYICNDPFKNMDFVHIEYTKPVTLELMNLYLEAMSEIENSVEIRYSFERNFAYLMVDKFFNTLTGNEPNIEFNANAVITYMSDKDKRVLRHALTSKVNLQAHSWTSSWQPADSQFQPMDTPNCVSHTALPLTWWHSHQIEITPAILAKRENRHMENRNSGDLFANSLCLGVVVYLITKSCCPRQANRPRQN